MRLGYGGGDITQTFYWLLQKCAFPYKNCKEDNTLDTMLLRKLKEEFCHVNLVSSLKSTLIYICANENVSKHNKLQLLTNTITDLVKNTPF